MTIDVGYGYLTQLSLQEKLQIDEEVQANRDTTYQVVRDNGQAFGRGMIFGLLTAPSLALAKDEVAKNAQKQAPKELAKRLSNAITCGTVVAACTAKSGSQVVGKVGEKVVEQGAHLASQNPVGWGLAFLCGASVAWCAKYAIFDK
jgi:hypothetical protein